MTIVSAGIPAISYHS